MSQTAIPAAGNVDPTLNGTHVKRLSGTKSVSASVGKDVGEMLLVAYAAEHPEAAQNPHKWRMFSEIVMRMAFDMAGNRFAQDAKDLTFHTDMDLVFDKLIVRHEDELRQTLAEQRIAGPQAEKEVAAQRQTIRSNVLKEIFAYLPSFTKGFVQTPHPTEVLSRDAIEAEQQLHLALATNNSLFNGKTDVVPYTTPVLAAMDELYKRMMPLEDQMSIPEEMKRSIAFSENMFDSVPITAQSVLDSAARKGAYAHGQPLTLEQLMSFNFMLQPDTWSPGDRDSKSEMTAAILEDGITLNRRAMLQHYIKKLAEIIVDPATQNSPGHPATAELPNLKGELRTILWRVMQNLNPNDVEEYIARQLSGKISDQALEEIRLLHDIRHKDGSPEGQEAVRKAKQRGVSLDETGYLNGKDMLADMEAVRETPGAHFPAYILANGRKTDLSKLDALYIQANNFGTSALKSQIRENSEMHEEVMESVMDVLAAQKITIPGYDQYKQLQIEHAALKEQGEPGSRQLKTVAPQLVQARRQLVNAMLDMVMGNPELAARIQQKLTAFIDHIEPEVKAAQQARAKGKKLERGKERNVHSSQEHKVNMYETLMGFKLAANNPEAIPRYLIAECRSDVDVLEAFFLLKTMEPNETRSLSRDARGHIIPKVDIVPLVEHRRDVASIPRTMRVAFQNRHFSTHHDGLTDAHDPMINMPILNNKRGERSYDDPRANPAHRPMTVAEAKQMYNIPTRPADEKRPVQAMKMVMGAGSDMLKGVGSAGAAKVQNMIEELRESLLDPEKPLDEITSLASAHKPEAGTRGIHASNGQVNGQVHAPVARLLVDYTGSGGGIHRSQPVTSSFETVQGRSMRGGRYSPFLKTLLLLRQKLQKRLGLEERVDEWKNRSAGDEEVLKAQLNLGNMLGLPNNRESWVTQTSGRCERWMDKYQADMYDAPEFKAYLGFTANEFVKTGATFAARSVARARSQGDKGNFPPLVDVKNLRAIGYGGALNTSGSCASMYFGASAYLGLDEHGNIPEDAKETLRKLYLYDYKAQDSINRATYGIVMANMDIAWGYLGAQRIINDGAVHIIDSRGQTYACEQLAKTGAGEMAAVTAAKKKLKDTPEALEFAEKEILAMHMLARIDTEYQHVSKGLLQLHRLIKPSKRYTVTASPSVQPEAGADLLAELPSVLRMQIEKSLSHIDPERTFMANLFHSIVKGDVPLPDRRDPTLYPKIYHAMGAVFECFENVPRAYVRPNWALACEAQHGIAA